MKRILAMVLKDFLRVKWYVATWIALALLELGLGANQLFGHGVVSFKSLDSTITTIHVAQFALTFLISALVVQTDPVIGTRAFWATRPIGPLRLCIAKFAGVFVMTVAIPVVMYAGWWLLFGFTPRDFCWAALETIGLQCLAALPGMMMAALTDTVTRLLVWSMVLAVAIVTGPVLWSGMVAFQVVTSQLSPIAFVRSLVQVVAFIVTAGIVTAAQLYFRRVFASVVVLLAGLFVTGYVGLNWPISPIVLDSRFVAKGESHREIGRDVTLEFKSAEIDDQYRSQYSLRSTVNFRFELQGVPAGYSVATGYSTQSLVWPSGLKMNVGTSFYPYVVRDSAAMQRAMGLTPEPDPETERWWNAFYDEINAQRLARGFRPIRSSLSKGDKRWLSRADWTVRAGVADLLPRLQPTYRLDVELRLLRPRIELEMPIHAGTRKAAHGYALRIIESERIENDGWRQAGRERPKTPTGEIKIKGIYGFPVLWRDRLATPREVVERYLFTIVNRTTGDWVGWFRPEKARVTVGCVGIGDIEGRSDEPMIRRGDAWIPRDPQFLEHATFVHFAYDEAARIRRQVVVEHLNPDVLPPIYPQKSK